MYQTDADKLSYLLMKPTCASLARFGRSKIYPLLKSTPCSNLAAGGRSSDGRRTVGGQSSDSGQRCPCRQRRRKKKHLIKAAPFGRLDQMLRTTVQGGSLGWLCPPPLKTDSPVGGWGALPSRPPGTELVELCPPPRPSPGWPSLAFDRGGQTEPPRSNAEKDRSGRTHP